MGDILSELKSFMNNDAGKGYKSIKKIEDAIQKKDMEDLHIRANGAIELFDSLLDKIGYKTNMVSIYHKQFLDGTKTKIRSYFWGELRAEEMLNCPESISVFLEKNDKGEVLVRLSLEISEKHINDSLLDKHNKIILESSIDGFCYAVNKTGNKDLQFVDTRADAILLLQNEEYRKVQLCKLTSIENITDEGLINELVQSVKVMMPIYKKICK